MISFTIFVDELDEVELLPGVVSCVNTPMNADCEIVAGRAYVTHIHLPTWTAGTPGEPITIYDRMSETRERLLFDALRVAIEREYATILSERVASELSAFVMQEYGYARPVGSEYDRFVAP